MMPEGDGLGPLQMGVSAHDRVWNIRSAFAQSTSISSASSGSSVPISAAQVQTDVERHLIVAAAGGMQALARLPNPAGELLFHKGVDILGGRIDDQLPGFELSRAFFVSLDDRWRPGRPASGCRSRTA